MESPKKSEKQKMLDEELYDSTDPELVNDRLNAKEICFEINHLHPKEVEKRNELLKKLLGKTEQSYYIEPPFYCDYGYNMKIGDNFYANHNFIVLDCNTVEIGHDVYIGPNVSIYTAAHPIDVKTRNEGLEFCKKIKIGNNVWIGGGVTILPGVTIGNNVTIGAGSVVTKDVPSNVTAFGNPCKVHKVNEENIGVE